MQVSVLRHPDRSSPPRPCLHSDDPTIYSYHRPPPGPLQCQNQTRKSSHFNPSDGTDRRKSSNDGQTKGGKESPIPNLAGTPVSPHRYRSQNLSKVQEKDPCPQAPSSNHSALSNRSSLELLMTHFLPPTKQTRRGLFQRLPGKLCPQSLIQNSDPYAKLKNIDTIRFALEKTVPSTSDLTTQNGLTLWPWKTPPD
jgi:hypothetical protein